MSTTRKNETKFDWSARGCADGRAKYTRRRLPIRTRSRLQKEGLKKGCRPCRCTITIRRALKLSQEEFAFSASTPGKARCATGSRARCEPDAAARAYLRVIAREPEMVQRALEPLPRPGVTRKPET